MSDWTKSIKGAAPTAPAAPETAVPPAVSTEKVRSVFGGSKPASQPAEAASPVHVSPTPARVVPTYDEPPMLDDAMKAALKAKAAETGAAIVSGIGKGASATFAKAKAMRADHGPRLSETLVQLRQQPIGRATKLVCGGIVGLAVLATAGIEIHAHRSVPGPTVAAVQPKAAAPVATPPTPAPTPAAPVVIAPTTAPTVAMAPASTSSTPATAATATCAFTGTVKTAAGAPIAGARVAMDARGSFRPSVTTDAQGGFTFTNTPGSNLYSLQVQAPGMRTVRLAMSPCVSGQVVVLEPVKSVAQAPVAGAKANAGSEVKAPMPAWQAKGNADLDAFAEHLKAHENAGGH